MPSLVRQRGLGLATCEGDDDVSKVDVAEALSWRGDPHLTCSDWTIVVATSEFDSRTYLFHKSILSVGPRSSKYFANLFMRQGSNYNQSQTTRIVLDEQDADSFPPFGIWHKCLTVKVTCWQSTNSSLSDSSLPLPRASQERDRRRR
jgi:hypothetical protein